LDFNAALFVVGVLVWWGIETVPFVSDPLGRYFNEESFGTLGMDDA
jgi:hypothetical protein